MKKFSQIKVKPIVLEDIQRDIHQIIDSFKNAETFEEQDKAFKAMNKYSDDLQTNITVNSIRYTVDTRDEEVKNVQDLVDEISPYFSQLFNEFNEELLKAKFRNELEAKYGSHLFKLVKNSLECFDEKIIPEMIEINKLCNEYSSRLANAKVEYNGQTYSLTQLGKFTESTDRNVRREVSILSAKFFEENDEIFGEIFSKLVKHRTAMAKKLGYESFTELGYKMMSRLDYGPKEVENYRKQILNDLVPFTQKLFARQINRTRIRNPQYYDYNVKFLSGNAAPKGDKEFILDQGKKMYKELSSETDKFFNFLIDNELMDLEAKPGKTSGGYMTYLPKYKAPFIFSNFNGTSGDVDVLTHEFGHAFQGYMSRNIVVPDYRSPTMESCEIHSMSMEFLTYPWMNLFFKEDEEKYRYSHLSDAICFIPYGVTVDEFQHWVYAHPEATHDERCRAYKEIEEKYLPHKKYDDVEIYERGRFWMKQRHIFESPFYYIDYTLAQVIAFEFFNDDRKNHQRAWNKYVRLCKMGGKYPFTELLEHAHLRNPFIDGNVKKAVKPLIKYLNNIDDTKY